MNADRNGQAAAVLLSGGVEGTTLLYEVARNSTLIGVFIDYHQRAARAFSVWTYLLSAGTFASGRRFARMCRFRNAIWCY